MGPLIYADKADLCGYFLPDMPKQTSTTKKPAKNLVKKQEKPPKKDRYFEAVGRRKAAVARVRLFPGAPKQTGVSDVTVNDKKLSGYFVKKHAQIAEAPFGVLSLKGHRVTVHVKGGGKSSQAEAVRLGLSRALLLLNPIWRSRLKASGYLKRDPRVVERKKYGLRKARRPQQWRKR